MNAQSELLTKLEARANRQDYRLVKIHEDQHAEQTNTQDQNQTNRREVTNYKQHVARTFEHHVSNAMDEAYEQIRQQEGEKQVTVNGENWTIQWGRRGLMIPGKCQICGDTANTMIGIEPEDPSYLYDAKCCSEECAMQHAENGRKWLPFHTENEYNEWQNELQDGKDKKNRKYDRKNPQVTPRHTKSTKNITRMVRGIEPNTRRMENTTSRNSGHDDKQYNR